MKVVCVADLHGHLPEIPECDLLLLGGDYPPNKNDEFFWMVRDFAPWIKEQSKKVKKIIGVAGNHDFIFEKNPHLVPSMPWTYLQDSGCKWNDLVIWGSPWQPRFYDWAFNADEEELEYHWSKIPEETDILLLHGPPRGYGDYSKCGQMHTGSPSLLQRILEIQPKIVVAGHIHSGYGVYQIGKKTKFFSCSFVDDQYNPKNKPHVFEI
jgi:Icc-related predicted phosphoesterase